MSALKAKPPLRPEEWNFTSYEFGLEGRRLQACHIYEFAREVPRILEAFKKDKISRSNFYKGVWVMVLFKKKKKDPKTIDCFPYMGFSYFDLGWMEPGKGATLEHVMVRARKGFPKKPFLKHSKKAKALKVELIPPHKVLAPITQEREGVWVDTHRCLASEEELFCVRINWDYSNDAILAEFRQWLETHRPRKGKNKRGKGGDRQLLADLKALGAVRLIRHFNGSVSEAQKFTMAVSKNPLYRNYEEWKKARERVGALIKDWNSRTLMGLRRKVPTLIKRVYKAVGRLTI